MSTSSPGPAVPNPTPRVAGAVSADDVRAALGAYAELGPQYSDEVVDSFLEKLDEHLAAANPPVRPEVVRDRHGNPVLDIRGNVQFYPTTVPVQAAAAPPQTMRVRAGQFDATLPVVPRERRPITPFAQRVSILSIILGAAIPLTAIAGGMAGLTGLFIVWVGIVIVAVVQAWSQR